MTKVRKRVKEIADLFGIRRVHQLRDIDCGLHSGIPECCILFFSIGDGSMFGKGRTQQGAVMPTPQDKWEWFGTPGHFCSPQRCQFHMTTRVGKYLISSVGEYFSNGIPLGGWEWKDLEEVGLGRKYETMVFKFKGICRDKECDC